MTIQRPASRAPHRIADIALDSGSIVTRSAELEIERHRALSDLLHENAFRLKEPAAAEGPYRLRLSLAPGEGGLDIAVHCTATGHRAALRLPLAPLGRHMHDYTIICENFHKTAKAGQMHRLEAIDAGRRAVHDEAAAILAAALEDKVVLDKTTARRLFSLIYVLHMRNTGTIS